MTQTGLSIGPGFRKDNAPIEVRPNRLNVSIASHASYVSDTSGALCSKIGFEF